MFSEGTRKLQITHAYDQRCQGAESVDIVDTGAGFHPTIGRLTGVVWSLSAWTLTLGDNRSTVDADREVGLSRVKINAAD